MLKHYFNTIIILTSIILAGCSSISSIQNFSSKQKLYDDFNKNAVTKYLTVVLNNDSVFTAPYGAKIYHDSLIIFEKGDYAAELAVRGRDEIAEVTSAIKSMVARKIQG